MQVDFKMAMELGTQLPLTGGSTLPLVQKSTKPGTTPTQTQPFLAMAAAQQAQ